MPDNKVKKEEVMEMYRCVLIARKRIQSGHHLILEYSYAMTALLIIGTLEFTFLL
jgi:hypothetical protein